MFPAVSMSLLLRIAVSSSMSVLVSGLPSSYTYVIVNKNELCQYVELV